MNLFEYIKSVSWNRDHGISLARFEADDRLRAKLRVMCNLATALAELSTCSRLKVGCVIISPDFKRVRAVGYNGPAAGEIPETCTGVAGHCRCLHAEQNAVAKLDTAYSDGILICTDSPCDSCAGLLINCQRVSAFLFDRAYRDTTGVKRLNAAKILTASWKELL
jgi:dCMP deaminase